MSLCRYFPVILKYFFGNGCFPKWINFKVGAIYCLASPVGKSFMHSILVFAVVEGLLR